MGGRSDIMKQTFSNMYRTFFEFQLFTDKEEALEIKKNVVLQRDVENTMDRTY